jgi:hypothetical protein
MPRLATSDRLQRLRLGHDSAQGAEFVQVAEHLKADGLVQAAHADRFVAAGPDQVGDQATPDAPELPVPAPSGGSAHRGVDPSYDAVGVLAEPAQPLGGQAVDDQLADICHMPGSRGLQLAEASR